MGKVATYYRVSSSDQSTDSQRPSIERWLASNGLDQGRVRHYEDVASGSTHQRPALTRLITDVQAGRVTTLVVYRLDRLSRRMVDGLQLLQTLLDSGCRVVSVTQDIDLSGAVGRMMAAVLLGLAEIERETLRARQAEGIAVAKSLGKYKGRKAGTTKSLPSRAQALRAKGLTIPEIAQAMAVSPATVSRYLRLKSI